MDKGFLGWGQLGPGLPWWRRLLLDGKFLGNYQRGWGLLVMTAVDEVCVLVVDRPRLRCRPVPASSCRGWSCVVRPSGHLHWGCKGTPGDCPRGRVVEVDEEVPSRLAPAADIGTLAGPLGSVGTGAGFSKAQPWFISILKFVKDIFSVLSFSC